MLFARLKHGEFVAYCREILRVHWIIVEGLMPFAACEQIAIMMTPYLQNLFSSGHAWLTCA